MEKEITPTYKKLGISFVELGLKIDRDLDESKSGVLTFDRMNEIAETVSLLVEDDDDRLEIVNELKLGLAPFEKIAEHDAAAQSLLFKGAQQILIGMFKVAITIASVRVKREIVKIAPLARQHKAKEVAVVRACELAKELWDADERQEIRIGRMADMVYIKLAGEGMKELLPDSSERMKDWIKLVAPTYARKGGRNRKTP